MKVIKATLVIFFLASYIGFTQTEQKLDSLNQIITQTAIDSIKAKNHMEIALLMMYKDSEITKKNIDLAEGFFKKTPNAKRFSNFLDIKAQYMYTQSKYDSAMFYVAKAGDEFLKNGDSLKAALTKSNLANLVKILTRDDNQLQEIIDEIEPIAIQYKDTVLLSSTIANRADIALNKGHRNIAISLTKKAINLREQSNDSIRLPQEYFKIGRIYQELFEYKEAIHYFNKGITIEDALGKNRIKSQLLKIKGTSLIKLKRFNEADKSLKEALKISKEINFKSNITGTLIRLASLNVEEGDFDKAETHLTEASTLMGTKNTFSVDYNYHLIKGRMFLGKKKYRDAINSFDKSVTLSESNGSLVNQATSKKFKALALESSGNYKDALAVFKESI